uniref:Uncharacterized protein n=1 Tax=Chromera velia CCMP2878 TaxID=1169474 RepID=A0A0G4HNE5_9ALVE|mmetsp:Transcript_28826/g.56481  ORF Transcript_28826/g.56481 Transcript_28826/m.56481 type:complete len:151 (+) Transcript_28826:187-639(+)|eukprot:Cvel_29476.t1-p1 / transcript=Cvel_29476.t1 / gene=Cvel_29476 / organism=Chromera_velia_CCMP2878 / gene_product=hypothetical protein / transcript_product=hypothetical protein / location=Cvel_scaffold4042:7000-8791(-) / protein_length=150 / sequence_SO=supercontig / SO=protein_coding / is_pseudo=false
MTFINWFAGLLQNWKSEDIFTAATFGAGTAFALDWFGATFLENRLSAGAWRAYEFANRHHQYHSAIIMILASNRLRTFEDAKAAAPFFVLGSPLMCLTLYGLALTDLRRTKPWFGYIFGLRPLDIGLVLACFSGTFLLFTGFTLFLTKSA